MALVKEDLKNSLLTLFDNMNNRASSNPMNDDEVAQGLADIIDEYVKSATVTITGCNYSGIHPTGTLS